MTWSALIPYTQCKQKVTDNYSTLSQNILCFRASPGFWPVCRGKICPFQSTKEKRKTRHKSTQAWPWTEPVGNTTLSVRNLLVVTFYSINGAGLRGVQKNNMKTFQSSWTKVYICVKVSLRSHTITHLNYLGWSRGLIHLPGTPNLSWFLVTHFLLLLIVSHRCSKDLHFAKTVDFLSYWRCEHIVCEEFSRRL